MNTLSRRSFALGAVASTGLLAACGNGIGSKGSASIDARVDQTLNFLYGQYPSTQGLDAKSAGMLVMPLVTEAGFGIGGGYGRGALRVNDVTVDYYSATKGSFGLQIGAQQYAHVLFFMTEDALMGFRRSNGWAAGADVEYVFRDQGENIRAETTTATS
ncbi:MAG: YSC84-related protein, partial [Lentibacter algarum]|uniref:lipid-binding SYLF domain-containing protein n=1 Tax=Lentibacter algarum TaxID=576131 RepID=UPI003C77D746